MRRYEERTVLVTGATGGLGAEICRRLAAEGAQVVAGDLDGTDLAGTLATLTGEGHRQLTLDVSIEDHWSAAAQEIRETYGRLDVLVNNAAIGSIATVEDEDRERWDQVIAVDATGVWLGMKHLGPLIERSGGGSIVNVASILGSTGGFGNSVAYHAAKGSCAHHDEERRTALGDPWRPRELAPPGLHRDGAAARAVRGLRTAPGDVEQHPDGAPGAS